MKSKWGIVMLTMANDFERGFKIACANALVVFAFRDPWVYDVEEYCRFEYQLGAFGNGCVMSVGVVFGDPPKVFGRY